MARHRRKKTKPFLSLARHRQGDAWIGVKNKIRRAQSVLGGKFYTHDFMHEDIQWVDGYFLAPKPIFYNFALETAVYHFKEACMDTAWDEADKLVPHRFNLFEGGEKDPVTGNIVHKAREPRRHPEFDGMTRIEWVMARAKEIADLGNIKVHEEVTLHRDYAHGIGLHGTLNVPALTVSAIDEFIYRFLKNGEAPFKSAEPVIFTGDSVKHWGLDSNAIVEPWDYDKVETSD